MIFSDTPLCSRCMVPTRRCVFRLNTTCPAALHVHFSVYDTHPLRKQVGDKCAPNPMLNI